MCLGELPLLLLGAPHQPAWASVGSLSSLACLHVMAWMHSLAGVPTHACPSLGSLGPLILCYLLPITDHYWRIPSFLKGRLSARQMNQLHIAYGKGLEYYFSSASIYLFLLQRFLFLIVLVFSI